VDAIAETTTEKLLEDVLARSPDVLMPNLRLVGRQTETPGGPLDLLGVDEDGRLVVFELSGSAHLRNIAVLGNRFAAMLVFDQLPSNYFADGAEAVPAEQIAEQTKAMLACG